MLTDLAYEAKAERLERLAQAKLPPVWAPQPGPQALAYASNADVIGYGGAAGGGKSDLMLGMAGTRHQRSIIFRRVHPSLRGMIERSREIFNATRSPHSGDSFNESLHVWRLSGDRMIEFGSVQHDTDLKKYQGQPHDFIGIDEATEFSEAFVRFLFGWNRTTTPGQVCRALLTFNPPLDDAGAWVVRFFGPWLDKQHPRPAADGELRWYAMVDGKEIECAPEPFEHKGQTITPKSRTFFHAALADNPILAATGYGATIDAMPEPLRSLLRGNFDAAKVVDPWQVIPAEWVRLAQARWLERAKPEGQPTAVGADVVRGGSDQMAVAPVYGTWFDQVTTFPGAAIKDGPAAAAVVMPYALEGVPIGLDIIGIGGSMYDCLVGVGHTPLAINFGAGAGDLHDKSGKLKFRNVRAAAYWGLREALDPVNGEGLALPPDPEVLADLCAPRYKPTMGSILLEEKEAVKERIGRSPDKGDAIVMARWTALYGNLDLIAWGEDGTPEPTD